MASGRDAWTEERRSGAGERRGKAAHRRPEARASGGEHQSTVSLHGDVGGPWLHSRVTETGTRAHTGQSRTRRAPDARAAVPARPAGPGCPTMRRAPPRAGAAAGGRPPRRPAAGGRRPGHRARRPPWSRRSPPGSPRASPPDADPGADVRPAGSAALRDRIEARIGRAGPGGRPSDHGRAGRADVPGVRVRPAPAGGDRAGRAGAAAAHRPRAGRRDPRPARQPASAPARWPASLRQARRHPGVRGRAARPAAARAERGIGARTLAALGRSHGRPDWPAAARFLQEYVRRAGAARRHHPRQRGLRPGRAGPGGRRAAGRRPGLLAAERDRCRYVYVDELADTDPAQIDLLGLVAGGGAHVVGLRRPGLVHVRLPGRRPDRRCATSRPVPDRRRARRPARSCLPVEPPVRGRSWSTRPGGSRPACAARPRHRAITAADGSRPSDAGAVGRVEVCTLRSATSEAAFVAQRLREAHLRRGVPWSRMAIIVRSLQRHHAGLRRALTQAGVPVTTGAEDTALATQPAVAPLLLAAALRAGAGPFWTKRPRSRCCTRRWAGPTRSPSGGCGRGCARRRPAWATAVRPASCWSTRCATRRAGPGRAALGPPGAARGRADRDRPRGRRPADGDRRGRAVGGLAGQRPGRAVGRRSAPGAAGAGRTADRDLDAVLVLFDAAARFTDRLPGARIEVFLDHLLDQQLPADTLAPSADRGEAVRILTAHAAKGLEWDRGRGGRRAGGRLARPAPARSACSAPSGWSTWPPAGT